MYFAYSVVKQLCWRKRGDMTLPFCLYTYFCVAKVFLIHNFNKHTSILKRNMFTIKISTHHGESEQEITNIDGKKFELLLKTKWDEIHTQSDVFRYKVNNNNLRESIINNRYILLLNPDRGSKRREPEFINSIHQPFNPDKFHFNKTSPKEHLFTIQEKGNADLHLFLVNVSPICQYHTLLCPSVSKCLPQVVTEDSIRLVLGLKLWAQDRDLKIGFNSLCAFASVNHLHYHLMYVKNSFHVETDKCTHIKGPLYLIKNVVPAFCFQVTTETMSQAANDIYRLTEYFVSKSIGHNILITNGEPVVPGSKVTEVMRAVVTPRQSTAGIKQLTSFNVAVLELSGWFPVFNPEHFDMLTAADLENELRKWNLPNFEEICDEVKSMY